MNEPTYDEVLNIMVDGGKKLCDYALEQWISYAYAHRPYTQQDEIQRQEFILRWNKIKRMIDKNWVRLSTED